MKDQDSLWIINILSWYYKFSKSIVISFFYPFLLITTFFTISTETVPDTSDIWPFPSNQGCTDLVHVRPIPSLRGLNNLGILRLYDSNL